MLTNAQMIPDRFAKLARGRRIMARANAAWDRGGFVRIGTATRYTDLKPKHRDLLVMGDAGTIFIRAGKRLDCCDFATFQFSA